MTSETAPLSRPLIAAIEGCAASHIVHVGGGDGTVLAELLGRFDHTTGVLYDRSATVAAAGSVLDAAGVADRVDVVASDLDDAVPPGGDAYLVDLGRPSDDATHVLGRCRAVMAATASLVAYEPTADGTQRRTTDVLVGLVKDAGFDITSCNDADPAWRVLLARPRRR